jgi:hypothetical protein
MKKEAVDMSWLPAREEWDFRSVTETECRVACHWEYARDIRQLARAAIVRPSGIGVQNEKAEGEVIKRDIVTKNAFFPRAWTNLSAAERTSVLGAVAPPPPLQVRTLREFVARANWIVDPKAEQFERLSQGAYVIRPNFSALGVEVIIKEFEKWARKEAKNYARSPRAKAAEPPFDLLKWLSVYRLEAKRCEAGITYETAQESLREYRRGNGKPDPNDVFPVYASHGAWSKARRDAERVRAKVIGDFAFLLRDWCLPS